MQFTRTTNRPLIAGANLRNPGTRTPFSLYWAMCAQAIYFDNEINIFYRGMLNREWAPNPTPPDPTRTGVSQFGVMSFTEEQFKAGDRAGEGILLIPASIGAVTHNGVTRPTPINTATPPINTTTPPVLPIAVSQEVALGEWNDHVLVKVPEGPWLMFVSLFYTYNDTSSGGVATYYTDRGASSSTIASKIIVLKSSNPRTANSWEYLGEAKLTGGAALGPNIGPTWIQKNPSNNKYYIYMLVPGTATVGGVSNKAVRRLAVTEVGSSFGAGSVWTRNTGYAFACSNTNKQFNYDAMIVGRAFKHGSYVYALMPGSHMHKDWPSGIGLYRASMSSIDTDFSSAIWEACPYNPVFQRGPSEGGCWQLCPITDENGVLYSFSDGTRWATYQTWSILIGDDASNEVGNPTAKALRTTPYYGLSTGYTHKHIAFCRLSNSMALSSWTDTPIPLNKNVRLYNPANGGYLVFKDNIVSCVPALTGAFAGKGGWYFRETIPNCGYVRIHPTDYGPGSTNPSSYLCPSGIASGDQRDAARDMTVVVGLTLSKDLTPYNLGFGDTATNDPENFRQEWLVTRANGTGPNGGLLVRIENRESSLALTCEKNGAVPAYARQRFPNWEDTKLWEVTEVPPT